jgi:hypothetical protein
VDAEHNVIAKIFEKKNYLLKRGEKKLVKK